MSINIKELIGTSLKEWISSEIEAPDGITIAEGFWINPVSENDPDFDELIAEGIAAIESTRVVGSFRHESLLYIIFEDEVGRKVSISHSSGLLSAYQLEGDAVEFIEAGLHFLQLAYLVTKFNIPACGKIPHALVSRLPIFEDDIIPFFPKMYTFELSGGAEFDEPWIVYLKVSLMLEAGREFISEFSEEIVAVAISIPSEGHEWIFEQLIIAVQSGRGISFYLELYKIFEFFFPLDSVFKLADRLGFGSSELELLEHCRGALSWNVNHQRGARSALAYATTTFAEICLGETCSELQAEISFKEKAMEKMTAARHSLTHQDFKSVAVPEIELKRMTHALLVFLQEAFKDYSQRRKSRTERRSEVSLGRDKLSDVAAE